MTDQRLDTFVVALTAGLTACIVSVALTCFVWYAVLYRALRRHEALMQSQVALLRHVRGAVAGGAPEGVEEAWPRQRGRWWWRQEEDGSRGRLGSWESRAAARRLPSMPQGYGACEGDGDSLRNTTVAPSPLFTLRAQVDVGQAGEQAVVSAAISTESGIAQPIRAVQQQPAIATDTFVAVAPGGQCVARTFCPASNKGCTALSTAAPSRYKIVRLIGYGSFASIYLVESRLTRQQYALKYIICHDDRRRMAAIRECETISSVQGHPNIIRIVDMFTSYAFEPHRQPVLGQSAYDAVDGTAWKVPQYPVMNSVQWTGVGLTPANNIAGTEVGRVAREEPPLALATTVATSEPAVASHTSFLSAADTERLMQNAQRLCRWRRDAQLESPPGAPPVAGGAPPQVAPPASSPAEQIVALRLSSSSPVSSQEEPLQPVWDVVHGVPPPQGARNHISSRSTVSTRMSERAAATPCSHQSPSLPATTKPNTLTTTVAAAQMSVRTSYAPGGAAIRYTDFDMTPPQYVPRRWQTETHYRNFAKEAAPPHATRQSSTSASSRAGAEAQHCLAPPTASAAALSHSANRTEDVVAAPPQHGQRQSCEMQSGSTSTQGSEAWRDAGYLCLVLEYHSMGDLGHYVRCQQRPPRHGPDIPTVTLNREADDFTARNPLTEAQLLSIAYQLSSVLHFLHTRSPPIVHRDLKPENILIKGDAVELCAADGPGDRGRRAVPPAEEDGRERDVCVPRITRDFVPIVVTDFGLAVTQARSVAQQRRQGRGAGTWPYIAPECWNGQTTTASDMWSLGCVLYALATGRLSASTVRPMSSEARQPTFARNVLDDLLERHYSLMFGTFVLSLLTIDPDRRLSAAAAQACFRVVGDDRVIFDSQSAFFSNVLDL